MIRLFAIVIFVFVAWLALVQIFRFVRSRDLDWNGLAFAAGFVALAFYLRHVTGIG